MSVADKRNSSQEAKSTRRDMIIEILILFAGTCLDERGLSGAMEVRWPSRRKVRWHERVGVEMPPEYRNYRTQRRQISALQALRELVSEARSSRRHNL
jgi:hypothetical protein